MLIIQINPFLQLDRQPHLVHAFKDDLLRVCQQSVVKSAVILFQFSRVVILRNLTIFFWYVIQLELSCDTVMATFPNIVASVRDPMITAREA